MEPNTRIGKLVTVKIVGRTPYRDNIWECKCDCGNSIIRGEANLKKNQYSSCGCYTNQFLIPGNSKLCSKAGKARAKARNVNGMNVDMTFRKGTISTNTSGVQGVSWSKAANKWHVYVGWKSYRCNLGYVEDLETAKEIHAEALKAIKNDTFREFFYQLRGFYPEEKLNKQFKRRNA